MARQFPGNTSPSSGTKGTARSKATQMGAFCPPLTHGGKEYTQVSAKAGAGKTAEHDSDDMGGLSLATPGGKEYRTVTR